MKSKDEQGWTRNQLETLVENTAKEYSLPPDFVKRLVTVESDWDFLAANEGGDRGLMQINDRWWYVSDFFDPRQNVRKGCEILRWLYDVFDGDLYRVAAGYTWGIGNVTNAMKKMHGYWLVAAPKRIQKYVMYVAKGLEIP